MKLISFQVFSNNIARLDFAHGTVWVDLDQNSGRVLTRNKVGYFPKIQHTGIYLGKNRFNGIPLVIHNHYHYGTSYISSFDEYRSGVVARWQEGTCTNRPNLVITIGLNQVVRGERYRPITNNCQVMTNTACHNRRDSEDVTKLAGKVLGVIAITALIKAIAA